VTLWRERRKEGVRIKCRLAACKATLRCRRLSFRHWRDDETDVKPAFSIAGNARKCRQTKGRGWLRRMNVDLPVRLSIGIGTSRLVGPKAAIVHIVVVGGVDGCRIVNIFAA